MNPRASYVQADLEIDLPGIEGHGVSYFAEAPRPYRFLVPPRPICLPLVGSAERLDASGVTRARVELVLDPRQETLLRTAQAGFEAALLLDDPVARRRAIRRGISLGLAALALRDSGSMPPPRGG